MKTKKSTLVVFSNGDEIIVCTKRDEWKVMEDWFCEGSGRTVGDDAEDYRRNEIKGAVCISRGWLSVERGG